MLILDQQNLDLKRLINIQKCHSSSKFDHCAILCSFMSRKCNHILDINDTIAKSAKLRTYITGRTNAHCLFLSVLSKL